MNARIILICSAAAALLATVGPLPLRAQPDTQARPPARGQEQTLTDQQKALVKSILSKYNASLLTAEDARTINESFRAAGIHGGPGLREAIQSAGFDPEAIRKLAPPPDRQRGLDGDQMRRTETPENMEQAGNDQHGKGGGYSLEQAISDRAQLTTIAFDGLAFMTGDFGCNTFLPPGKVSDFFGFQYMRDIDAAKLGHNTSFLTRIANNMLAILNDAQKQQLIALAKEQEPGISELAFKRFPLIKSFCRLRDGDVPAGKNGLDQDAVKKYTAEIYALSGKLAYRRAQVLGAIARSFDDAQKAKLAALKFGDSSTWPDIADQLDKRSYSHGVTVAVMTYASELFSWYAGPAEAGTYFCPEGHGTYFGAFYMKDMPAMGNANYSISTSITGDNGEQFLASLTADQRARITKLVDLQRGDLGEIVKTRRAIATLLRDFLKSGSVDQDRVTALAKQYGELDGEISSYYATAFASVYKTLTSAQKATLVKLRNLDGYQCKGAFLYSQPIAMPEVPNTDFLFGSETKPEQTTSARTTFVLRSPAVADGGQLPKEYTGDGASATLPLEWSGAPAGTKSFALIMHHLAPDQVKWYWTLYGIPAGTTSLPRNATGVGTLGNNSVNGRIGYAPPHSKGPGAKTYVYTLYALSAEPKPGMPSAEVSRDVLLRAMQGTVIDSAQLNVVYTRLTAPDTGSGNGR